jgi:hypothetical protein
MPALLYRNRRPSKNDNANPPLLPRGNANIHGPRRQFETAALTNRRTSSATVSQESISTYNDLKLNKKLKYIVFKLSDDNKEIVVEHASESDDWEEFREKLINATSKTRSVRLLPRDSRTCARSDYCLI